MAALKNGAELKSRDARPVETVIPAIAPLALVEQGEERVVSVNSPARELQSRLEAAASLEWLATDREADAAPKHIVAGIVLMSTVAVIAWTGIINAAIALM